MKISKYRLVDCIWGALIMGMVLSFAMPMISNGFVTLAEFLSSLIVSFFVGLAIMLFSPIRKISARFATKCGAENGTVKYSLCSAAATTLLMGTAMSIIMTWWGMHAVPGYQSQLFHAWISAYPWVLIVVFIMVNFCQWSGKYVVKLLFGDAAQEKEAS
ncbi:MAG: hypothetical protein GX418_06115 [Clostridiales bacterium]|nr:hypothetical protein [Clostridiales bacterium]